MNTSCAFQLNVCTQFVMHASKSYKTIPSFLADSWSEECVRAIAKEGATCVFVAFQKSGKVRVHVGTPVTCV